MNANIMKSSFPFTALLFAIACLLSCSKNTSTENVILSTTAFARAYPAPPLRTYPSSSQKIYGWINTMDNASMRAHAWDIWESINTTSPDSMPVWETWFSGYEIFADTTPLEVRVRTKDFAFPSQFFHASVVKQSIPNSPNEKVTSFNRYSPSLARYIYGHDLYKKSRLNQINDSFNIAKTNPAGRLLTTSIDTIDAASFALKPVFQFISGNSPTAIPYWAGITVWSTTNLINPTPGTWRQCVVVDPSETLKPGTTAKMSCNAEAPQDWPVVSLNDFYHFEITQAIADSFSMFAATSGDEVGQNNQSDSTSVVDMVKAGNIAMLMAMHVTGKEINNWTWQTFWWSADNQNPIYGKDRPATLKSPWNNYNMNLAYYMVSPPGTPKGGEPVVTFNPYLETNLFGVLKADVSSRDSIHWYGVFSNCMSCHRMAAWEISNYIPNGNIDPADPVLFSKNTKTDFLWSIPVRAR